MALPRRCCAALTFCLHYKQGYQGAHCNILRRLAQSLTDIDIGNNRSISNLMYYVVFTAEYAMDAFIQKYSIRLQKQGFYFPILKNLWLGIKSINRFSWEKNRFRIDFSFFSID